MIFSILLLGFFTLLLNVPTWYTAVAGNIVPKDEVDIFHRILEEMTCDTGPGKPKCTPIHFKNPTNRTFCDTLKVSTTKAQDERMRGRATNDQKKGHSYIPWDFTLYFRNPNIAVVNPAKNMFSVMHLIARERNDTACPNGQGSRPGRNVCDGNGEGDEVRIQEIEHATRILTIRDPFDRILSAYSYAKSELGYPINVGGKCPHASVCTFKDWLREVKTHVETLQSSANIHVRTQVSSSRLEYVRYHYLIRIGAHMDIYCLFLLLGENFFEMNMSSNFEVSLEDKAKLFDDEMIEIVRSVYAEDIVLWMMAERTNGLSSSLMDLLI